jgi:hypothetical protein
MICGRNKAPFAVAILAIALASVPLAGCSMDRWAKAEPGEYAAIPGEAAITMPVAREIQTLAIDRAASLLVLTLVDGTEIVAPFVPRDRAEWPSGCPTNIHSTRMEVLDIARDPLTIGTTSLSRAIVVRDCPRDPVRIVLREDGEMGGARTACPHPAPCIIFAPTSATSPSPTPLPH